jgi:predicted ATPase
MVTTAVEYEVEPTGHAGREVDDRTVIRTPDKRVRVFISSSLGDLAPERQAASDAISQLRLTPVLFELGARPYPPRELYRAYLQQSDVFVGIYAQSYGWVAPGMDVSGLEDEYRLSAGKPRLIYVKAVPEREPRLRRLLDAIRAEAGISYRHFRDADELRRLVADDLALLLTERFATTAMPLPSEPPAAPLPMLRRPLVNRTEELHTVTGLLQQAGVSLVTLTGPGGVGKTALALAAANAVADRFADGAAFLSLETLTDPALLRGTVVQQLRIPTPPGQSLDDSLLDFFRPRKLLAVVDNAEQLVAAAPLAGQILEVAPGLKVLVTSREPLRLRGERVVPVGPLAVPEPDAARDPSELAAVPAVAFFLTCAREVQPDFALTAANAAAVAEICRRLDGLPLALELAAARLSVLSPAGLLDRLNRRLQLLTAGPRDLPARQQTMRAAIAWSYDLLTPAEQRLFRGLGVFQGAFTLEAVEAVATGSAPELDPLEGIGSLVGKSLVFIQPLDESWPWYGMLETIREFALEELDARGETSALRRRHAEYVRDVAGRGQLHLLQPAERDRWLLRFEHGLDSVRIALRWSLSPEGDLSLGVALEGALGWFWLTTGRLIEGQAWFDRLLARRGPGDDGPPWARLLYGSALLLWRQRDAALAASRTEEAVAIFRGVGEGRWLAYALALLARVRLSQARPAEARPLLEEARSVWRRIEPSSDQPFEAYLRYYLPGLQVALSSPALLHGDADAARTELERSLPGLEATGDDAGRAIVLGTLGLAAAQRGDHAEARTRFDQSLPLLRRGHDAWALAWVLVLAGLEELRSAPPSAGPLLVEALRACQRLGLATGVGLALAGLGEVAAAAGAARRAGQLLGASRRLLADADPLLHVIVPYDLPASLASARAAGDSAEFDRGLTEGQRLTLDQAIAAGLAGEAGALGSQRNRDPEATQPPVMQ